VGLADWTLNLLTPLFATAMMVHVHKAVSARQLSDSPVAV
jgi:uncharacterized protein involved in cysteine biosynthesis